MNTSIVDQFLDGKGFTQYQVSLLTDGKAIELFVTADADEAYGRADKWESLDKTNNSPNNPKTNS